MTTESRTDRFMARIDAHLATLPESKRRPFLAKQLWEWESRYTKFQTTDGDSEPVTDPADPPMATDFVLTICCLSERLQRKMVP
jgi:hypothetical protein